MSQITPAIVGLTLFVGGMGASQYLNKRWIEGRWVRIMERWVFLHNWQQDVVEHNKAWHIKIRIVDAWFGR